MTVAVWEAMRRRPVRFLFGAWPLRSWAFLLSGLVVGPVVLFVCAALLLVGVGLSVVGVGLLVLLTLAVVGIPVAALERRRLRLVEPEPLLDPHGSLPGTSALPWLRTRLRERATWRELAYTVLLGVVFTATGIGFAALLGLSLILTATPVIVWAIAPDTVMLVPGQPLSDPVAALPGSAAGLVGLVVSAYAGGLLAGVQVRTAQFLLAARDEDFSSRVIELTRSRARLVDAFEAERRRIERDLHDGAQQQLVALTMTLGLAELELRGQDSGAALSSAGPGTRPARPWTSCVPWYAASTRRSSPTTGCPPRSPNSPCATRFPSPSTWTCRTGCRPPWRRPRTSPSRRR